MCTKGRCQAGNFGSVAKAWFTSNLQISIPVTIVAGLIFLGILYALFRSAMGCCRRRSRTRSTAEPALGAVRGQRVPSWGNVPPATTREAPRTSYDASRNVPTALQPGMRSSYHLLPAEPSYEPSGSRRPGRPGGASRHTPAPSSRSNWVDDRMYNGR